tara:strand:+ start:237 stop:896 length:660 start_codon:yes stop_codon:yes gene_type:complete
MKILILILSCKDTIYQDLKFKGIEKTWNSFELSNIETFYYYGGYDSRTHTQRDIYLTEPDSLNYISTKTIECFEYALKHFEFDYIFRTNSSSYINKHKLVNWLEGKSLSNFYSGFIGIHEGIQFASGCGYTISRDLVNQLVRNKNNIRPDWSDDVIFANIINTYIEPAPRINVMDIKNGDYKIENNFHWRCKCPDDRKDDIYHMHNIHNAIYTSNKILK